MFTLLQYSPHNNNVFSALFDSGVCQASFSTTMRGLYLPISVFLAVDMGQATSVTKQFSVHSGPAYLCAWHPTMENWIASSGRDKKIKVREGGREGEGACCDINDKLANVNLLMLRCLLSLSRYTWCLLLLNIGGCICVYFY